METTETGIARAIRIAGGQRELARRVGVTQQAVQQWAESGRVPAARCQKVASVIDGAVSLHELNPHVYPPPKATAAA